MSSFKKPTAEEVQEVLHQIDAPHLESYFFRELENPEWIRPLYEHGAFRYPPTPNTSDEGTITHYPWEASAYLVRMAPLKPSEVAEVFAHVETENAAVVADMARAATMIPPSESLRLVPRFVRAAEAGCLIYSYVYLAKLCRILVQSGDSKEALSLFRSVFKPRYLADQKEPIGLSRYQIENGLTEVTPTLVAVIPAQILQLISGWLIDWMKRNGYKKNPSDMSPIWRPAIEEHCQNRNHTFSAFLVDLLRDSFEGAIERESLSLVDALSLLDKFGYLVFRRMSLHLLSRFAEESPDLVRKTLMERELFGEHRIKHEYAALAGAHFGLLDTAEQDTWMGWIRSGPNLDYYTRSFREREGRKPTRKEVEDRKRWWQYEHLHWIRAHLEGEWRTFYDEMMELHDEPLLSDLSFRIDSNRSFDEPVQVEDLSPLTLGEAVKLLRDRVLGGGRDRYSKEMLSISLEDVAGAFRRYIALKPLELSRDSLELTGHPEVLVRSFLWAMGDAVKAGVQIDVDSVLELASWVLRQASEMPHGDQAGDAALESEDWQWSRDQVSYFLEEVCSTGGRAESGLTLSAHRQIVWGLISQLSRDPAESYVLRNTDAEDPRLYDYLELALNSPRGKALGALLEYARWVSRTCRLERCHGEAEWTWLGEVKNEIEWHLDVENRTVVAMAMLGFGADLLYHLDERWFQEQFAAALNIEDSLGESGVAEAWAAWNSLVMWVRPNLDLLRVLGQQYQFSVEEVAPLPSVEADFYKPRRRLAEQIILFYVWGHLDLGLGGLLGRFLEVAEPGLRIHAVSFAPTVVDSEESVAPETVLRLLNLWELYWPRFGSADAEGRPRSRTFEDWFLSDHLPRKWRVERLNEYLAGSEGVQLRPKVVELLDEFAGDWPAEAVAAVQKLVSLDEEGWQLSLWKEALTSILRKALDSGGRAGEIAGEVVDQLTKRGLFAYGDLLTQGPS